MLLDQKITVRGSKSVLGGRRWWCYQWGVITGVRPPPQFSIAMMTNGCSNLPSLDEILDLSLTVAPAAAAAAAAAAPPTAATSPTAEITPHQAAEGAGAEGGGAGSGGCGSNGGSNSSSSSGGGRVCYRGVKFALPEEGDVSFCELVPLRLMNLLTNQ